jgi:hypothetical protein
MILISLQDCRPLFPSCNGMSTVTVVFTFTDVSGNTGTVTCTGKIAAFYQITDINYLSVDGSSGSSSFTNIGGIINLLSTFDPGYKVDENKTVSMHVTDCEGYENVEDVTGYTDAIMTHSNEYIADENGDYLIFI